jgi:outer membrane lipoprotein
MQWWQKFSGCGLIVLIALAAAGCAHTISQPVREQAEPPVPFAQLRDNPDAYKERTVILGGEVVQTQNVSEGTLLEVVQKPLDAAERPLLTDHTDGRFMALCDRYLDPAVYAQGRDLTVAGRVLGTRTGQIGELTYTYPLISCVELHLWPRYVSAPGYYYAYPWFWDPWYWDPWYWHPYYYRYWGHSRWWR